MKQRIPVLKSKDVILFAQFISQLIREEVNFVVHTDDIGWEVELTGEYR